MKHSDTKDMTRVSLPSQSLG